MQACVVERRDDRLGSLRSMRRDMFLKFLDLLGDGGTSSLHELMTRILARACTLVHAEAGAIFILRRKGRSVRLEPIAQQGDGTRLGRKSLDPMTIAGNAAKTKRPVLMRQRRTKTDLVPGAPLAVLALPLLTDEAAVVGVITFADLHRPSRHETLSLALVRAVLPPRINRLLAGAIERAALVERISVQNAELARRQRRIATLQRETEAAFLMSVEQLARAAELHDEETGNHILRVNEYSFWLARRLGQPRGWCDELRYSAQLHDVGKMSVDAAILKKEGLLEPTERAEMNRHPEYGRRILGDNPRLRMAADIAHAHHERWDGSGYPRGLHGEAIPLAARIVRVADVYDALRSTRPYKPGYDHERAMQVMLRGDERIDPRRDFDPALLRILDAQGEAFARIWRELAD
jgi:hypothetical protein